MNEVVPPAAHGRELRALVAEQLLDARGAQDLAAGAVPVVDEAGQGARGELQSRLAGLERERRELALGDVDGDADDDRRWTLPSSRCSRQQVASIQRSSRGIIDAGTAHREFEFRLAVAQAAREPGFEIFVGGRVEPLLAVEREPFARGRLSTPTSARRSRTCASRRRLAASCSASRALSARCCARSTRAAFHSTSGREAASTSPRPAARTRSSGCKSRRARRRARSARTPAVRAPSTRRCRAPSCRRPTGSSTPTTSPRRRAAPSVPQQQQSGHDAGERLGMRSKPRLASAPLPSSEADQRGGHDAASPALALKVNSAWRSAVRKGAKSSASAVAANMMPVAPAMRPGRPELFQQRDARRSVAGRRCCQPPKASASSGPKATPEPSNASSWPRRCAQRGAGTDQQRGQREHHDRTAPRRRSTSAAATSGI